MSRAAMTATSLISQLPAPSADPTTLMDLDDQAPDDDGEEGTSGNENSHDEDGEEVTGPNESNTCPSALLKKLGKVYPHFN